MINSRCLQYLYNVSFFLFFCISELIFWQKLDYFNELKKENDGFDVYFQNDGSTSLRFRPLSANSGFFFVRNNERTKNLFKSLLIGGDRVLQWASQQSAFNTILDEHISLFGLRVKILPKYEGNFLGGQHFHEQKNFMKEILEGKKKPFIFHMSWTLNKQNKINFFQQLGEWFLHDSCIQSMRLGVLPIKNGISLMTECCLIKPNITCHYRDKPSKISCAHKDPIDKGKPSFW